jgi:hypothetical protein
MHCPATAIFMVNLKRVFPASSFAKKWEFLLLSNPFKGKFLESHSSSYYYTHSPKVF